MDDRIRRAVEAERNLWRRAMHDHIAAFRRALDKYDEQTQHALIDNIMIRLDTVKTIELRVDAMRGRRMLEKEE
jgi:hypothetical protein